MTDPINIKTINTTAKSGEPNFDHEMLVITTGDQVADGDLRKAFAAANVSSDVFNTDEIPDPETLGLSPMVRPLFTLYTVQPLRSSPRLQCHQLSI